MKRPIYICLAADDNYSQLAEVAMVSVLDNNIDAPEIEFYLLDSGIKKQNKLSIQKTVEKYGRKIHFIDVSQKLEDIRKSGIISQSIYNSFGAYARFFIVSYLPAYIDKILYIDCDVCANASLEELFNLELGDYVVGAVQDILPSSHNVHIGFKSQDKYFCSGVLLINVNKWKEEKIEKLLIEHINNIRSVYSYHDQDLINIVCKYKIYTLEPKYMVFFPEYEWGAKVLTRLSGLKNYYSNSELKTAVSNPVLIHYVDCIFGRPWNKGNYNSKSKIWENYKEKINGSSDFIYRENDFSFKHKLCIAISKTILNIPLQFILNIQRVKIVKQRDTEADIKWNNIKCRGHLDNE